MGAKYIKPIIFSGVLITTVLVGSLIYRTMQDNTIGEQEPIFPTTANPSPTITNTPNPTVTPTPIYKYYIESNQDLPSFKVAYPYYGWTVKMDFESNGVLDLEAKKKSYTIGVDSGIASNEDLKNLSIGYLDVYAKLGDPIPDLVTLENNNVTTKFEYAIFNDTRSERNVAVVRIKGTNSEKNGVVFIQFNSKDLIDIVVEMINLIKVIP